MLNFLRFFLKILNLFLDNIFVSFLNFNLLLLKMHLFHFFWDLLGNEIFCKLFQRVSFLNDWLWCSLWLRSQVRCDICWLIWRILTGSVYISVRQSFVCSFILFFHLSISRCFCLGLNINSFFIVIISSQFWWGSSINLWLSL